MTRSPLAAAVALLVSLPGQALADDIDERAPAAPDGRVEISNVAGRIEVRGWDADEVQVAGELGRNAEFEFLQSGDRTYVKVFKRRDARRVGSSRLIVDLPHGSEISVAGVSADIDVRDVRGV